MKRRTKEDIMFGLVLSLIVTSPFVLAIYLERRRIAESDESQPWFNAKAEYRCINTLDNVKRRTEWCSTEGWKRESDTSRYGQHNPYLSCIGTSIATQRTRCRDAMKKNFQESK